MEYINNTVLMFSSIQFTINQTLETRIEQSQISRIIPIKRIYNYVLKHLFSMRTFKLWQNLRIQQSLQSMLGGGKGKTNIVFCWLTTSKHNILKEWLINMIQY